MAAKLLTNFKHLNGVSTFLLILDQKQLTYKISKAKRIAIANVVGLEFKFMDYHIALNNVAYLQI